MILMIPDSEKRLYMAACIFGNNFVNAPIVFDRQRSSVWHASKSCLLDR
jgi:hypothetical protein